MTTEEQQNSDKRSELTLEEKIKLVQERRELRAQKLKDTDKQLQALKRKLSVRNRKERAHRLIEVGAYFESLFGTSTKEDDFKKIDELKRLDTASSAQSEDAQLS